MRVYGNELRTLFWDYMPREYIRRLLRVVADSYSRADYACLASLELDEPEADNTRWAIRRAFIEGGMRQILPAFPTVRGEVIRGRDCPAPNPWNHTLISCGRVLLTQCSVALPDDIVRPSVSRELYSLPNEERFLFPDFQPKQRKQSKDSPLYSILVHGRELGKYNKLGFAFIRFPKPGAEEWYGERINLFTEFADVVEYLRDDVHPIVGREKITTTPPEERVNAPGDPKIQEAGDAE